MDDRDRGRTARERGDKERREGRVSKGEDHEGKPIRRKDCFLLLKPSCGSGDRIEPLLATPNHRHILFKTMKLLCVSVSCRFLVALESPPVL